MDITKLKDRLEPEDYAALEKHVADLIAQTDAARKESTEGRVAKKQELERLQAQQEKILKALGLSLPEELDNAPDMAARRADLERLAAQEKRLQKKLEAATAERDQAQAKLQGTLKRQALDKALAKHDFVDRDVVEAFIEPRLQWDGEDLIYVSEAGVPSSLEDGLKGLVRSKPSLLRNLEQGAGVPGSHGANPNMGGGRFERIAAIGRAFFGKSTTH
ncbi:MAG TPA: hypothetical protein DGF30_02780 [Desulfomicrobium sp.]|nr:hypothetical protein [Desulfomicrobium sp.]